VYPVGAVAAVGGRVELADQVAQPRLAHGASGGRLAAPG
jgi:hypothetical protein